jgi:hypothetical protein
VAGGGGTLSKVYLRQCCSVLLGMCGAKKRCTASAMLVCFCGLWEANLYILHLIIVFKPPQHLI